LHNDGWGIENLPYGVFNAPGGPPRVGVRYGDQVVDLTVLVKRGMLREPIDGVFSQRDLNGFLACGRSAWTATRGALQEAISSGVPDEALRPLDEVAMLRPVRPPDYVDFYSSIEHATNLGKMFRPGGEPLMENWRWLPVGYHGRSSSVVATETPVRRPLGQLPPKSDGGEPRFGPSRRLDFELELGFVTGDGPAMGEPLSIEEVRETIFGVVIVNDWSARDIQKWEYQPLGPFLGKSFGTSISAWVVPLDALEPYRVAGPRQHPAPLEYLRTEQPWGLDIELEVALAPEGGEETVISRTNARGLYWTMAQQLAHATINGARVRAGDLYASGTISGSAPGTYGSMIELSWNGEQPIKVEGGERTFLEDGDMVVMRGGCSGRGPVISLGDVRGTVLGAPELS